ncbi:putative beta-N-acetylglucosaminidase [Aspergillus clavatus NRRL 1]|uniref:Beta-N-acetylglucosaminidase, putative n=1 Tax=Aspergillus clavatus (strain ATCC 1007 / CBS 513.65 / DSM 816 / NCTC 3887 / NRRL 1 / QM 1276 / 107) TaxID=344612 RepID=A1CKS7_ASPCL|nr:beta-N-acetylglucosaminidase, putative [Aspergillus clavatus NRRL 1]EAW09751.1 beta-N-acetylglucosaminidase, putative [Aspergillus clavatus NRRL 1]
MSSEELRRKVGQLFAVGFHGLVPSPEIKTLIHEYGIGGVVLFKRNIQDTAQLQSLTLALQEEARLAGHERPLFIGIDQENGLVTRVSPPMAPQLPGPMALGATRSPELAYRVGEITGETLRFFGINMNYAPVCDINSEPLNPVIGVRSPGDDPEFVGRFASATAQGLREQKVIPSVKHFPGHGDTAVDSHYGLPVIEKTREQLEKCELIPFRRAVAEGIEAVMTAHISLPAIGDGKLPATLSADVLGILRNEMQYDGMIITDCLEMDGIRATYGTEQGALLALEAGSDSIMVCHTYNVQVASIERICTAVQSGRLAASRLNDACRRVATLKDKFLNWDTALRRNDLEDLVTLNGKAATLAKEAYSLSATLVRDDPGVLPLSKPSQIVLLFPGERTPAGGAVDGEGTEKGGVYNVTEFGAVLRAYSPNTVEIHYGAAGLTSDQWKLVESADSVVLVTFNARDSPFQRAMGLELPKHTPNPITVAACAPYDFIDDAIVRTYITTYEPTIEAFMAAADIIFGAIVAKGSLPVGPQKVALDSIHVSPFDPADLTPLVEVWNTSLPAYPLPADSLNRLLVQPNGHHFVARLESKTIGFCLLYTTTTRGTTDGQLAVLAVDPKHQGKGVGTALVAEARTWLMANYKPSSLSLGSSFPRFWPGIPTDLPESVQEFFVHRGFRLNPPVPRSVDLYQDIRDFQPPEKYMLRAKERGFTFAPLQSEHYAECLIGQKRNFSHNPAWVDMYHQLDPESHPSSIMTAFDPQGKQVGWTLMLAPSSPILQYNWAFPPLCGPQTGLIGCVGVDEEYRKAGVGLALLCHAIEDMKQRGVEGVFVDWVSLEGWYEQIGFRVWRSYRTGQM